MDSSNSSQAHQQGIEAFGINQQQYDPNQASSLPQNASQKPFPYGLTRFYGINDQPWSPLGKRSVIQSVDPNATRQLHAMVNYNPNTPSFQSFRNRPIPPSECDTTPDDSGYGGSRPPYSNASQYEGESNPETQNASTLMESLHLQGPVPNPSVSSWGQPPPTPSVTTAPPNAECRYHCSFCNEWLRTKSELNKHDARHRKPFHCDIEGCRRKDGFGTRNDLTRHKRSVHSDRNSSGPLFTCRLEPCINKDQSKVWTRADNFRSHLKRLHDKNVDADVDLKDFRCDNHLTPTQNSRPKQPALREDLQGVGGMSYMISDPSAGMQKSTSGPFATSLIQASQGMVPHSSHEIQDINQDLNSILQDSDSASAENAQPTVASAQVSNQGFVRPDVPVEAIQRPLQPRRSPNGQRMPLPTCRPRYTLDARRDTQEESELPISNDDDDDDDDDNDDDDDDDSVQDVDESSEQDGDSNESLRSTVAPPTDPEITRSVPKRPATEAADVRQKPNDPRPSTIPDARPDTRPEIPSSLDIFKQLRLEPDDRILQILKQLPKSLLSRAISESDDGRSSISHDSTSHKKHHPCPKCSKVFLRQCELRKHLKRHEKFYGCTFPKCPKAFGSKNDWKRHESSQHMQLETWKCEEKKSDSTDPCKRVFPRRESFRNHLNKEHHITDVKKVDEKLERCRIGRHCETRFWCGFCREIIEIREQDVNAWTKRCDHIDEHFCGRNGPKMNISKWAQIEDLELPVIEQVEVGNDSSSQEPGMASGSSSLSSTSSSLKRKVGDNGGARLHKKPRRGSTLRWGCCHCNCDNSVKFEAQCADCPHQRCDFCSIDMAAAMEEQVPSARDGRQDDGKDC